MFQVRPKSSRLTSVAALNPMRSSPSGETSAPSKSTCRVTGLVVSRTVRSPATSQVLSANEVTLVERNVMVGKRSTSKKSALLRWVSRSALPLLRLAAPISTSTCDASGSSAIVIRPLTSVNRPRTLVIIRWRPTNSTDVWAPSMS